jgi:hypothetical protein
MTSPAHRAVLGFLKGGLIAVVSIVIAPELAPLAAAFPALGWLVSVVQFLLPLTGFVFGAAIGADALGVGTRAIRAFGYGGGVAGLVLRLTAANLQGLTGFENPLLVVPYATSASLLAFGAMGLVGSLAVGRGKTGRIAAGFAGGGAIGGLLGIVPFMLLPWAGVFWSDLWMFARLTCSVGATVVPFVVGGFVAARAWE